MGIRRPAARRIVAEMLDTMIGGAPDTPGDERVLGIIRQQAERVRKG
jgi:hypothetical protein